jgi:uncharacterized membrane protein
MSSSEVLLLAFLIGVITGLRSLTAPAVVAYGAHKGWLNLTGTRLAFMGALWALIFFVLLAIVELIMDQLPSTPPRTKPAGLIARVLMGGLSGACVAVAGASSLMLGAVLGIVGAVAGAFGGYKARTGLVRALKVPDFVIACAEDLMAICGGIFIVSRF